MPCFPNVTLSYCKNPIASVPFSPRAPDDTSYVWQHYPASVAPEYIDWPTNTQPPSALQAITKQKV